MSESTENTPAGQAAGDAPATGGATDGDESQATERDAEASEGGHGKLTGSNPDAPGYGSPAEIEGT